MKKCYICSPFRGAVEENIEKTKRYCRDAAWDGLIPIAPHLMFTLFLHDSTGIDRWRWERMGMALLPECSEVRVFCDEVTEGMIPVILKAQKLKIPIKFYDSDLKEINYDALIINHKIGPGYRKIIAEAHGEHVSAATCPYAAECVKVQKQESKLEEEPETESVAEKKMETLIGETANERVPLWKRIFQVKNGKQR